MRKAIMICFLLGGLFGMLHGETIVTGAKASQKVAGAELLRYTDRSTAPSFIRFRKGAELPLEEAGKWLRHVLKMDAQSEFKISNSEVDHQGFTHVRLQQYFLGNLVEGGTYILHARNGMVEMVNGDYFPQPAQDGQASLGEAAALQAALNHVHASVYQWQSEAAEAMLRYESRDPLATFYPKGELTFVPADGLVGNGHRLAWKFDIYAMAPLTRAFVYVDAQNGSILWTQDRIHTADVTGTAATAYSGSRTITTDDNGGSFRLRETGRGGGIETYDCNTGTNYGNAVDFTDTDNDWNNVNAQQDEYATDAHWGAEMTYDYFNLVHGRNSIDGAGFPLISYVHYDNNFVNAFWDGQRMTYGDGNGTSFFPLTALDVAGHEIGHGLTTFSANLVYQNEPGALNESFSDIFGQSIEQWARPAQWSWTIGEDLTANGNGIRNMENPNAFQNPDTYGGTYYYTGTADNGGVHTNSGVQNKWFQIMVDGETGTNDLGDNYNVASQGWLKSSSIAFRNLTVYLTSNSDHADARFFAIQSATDLYGPCGPEVIATTNAWYAVGVGDTFSYTISADFAASPVGYCQAPATVSFANQSINGGSYVWDFGDGNTSTDLNPTHIYQNFGTYTVKLIADGGPCGMDSVVRTSYIQVDPNITCTVSLSPTNTNQTQTTCEGILYDTGGPTNDYGDNQNSEITIAPPGATSVVLDFISFDFENNYDYLYIYDGPTINDPLIGSYTGATLPNGGNITSTGGAITLVQSSDQSVVAAGFELNWSCVQPNAAPSANFEADNLTSCNGLVNFQDLSGNGANGWAWDFGDGGASNQQNPSHTYSNNGVYTVRLISTNQVGSDTLVRTAYITINRPAGPTAMNANLCGSGTATLSTSGASGNLTWYDAPSAGNQVGTGSSFTTPVLTSNTSYYVIEEQTAPLQNIGPANSSSLGAGGYHNNTSIQYLEFTVQSALTLVSVYVDPGSAGNRTINLWNSGGTLLRDSTVNMPANPGRVNLGWELQPGDYRIGGSQMDLFRNNAVPNGSYPIDLAGMASITGTSAGAGYYYYLYDWEVQGPSCISEPSQVDVTVNAPAQASISNNNGTTLCQGESTTLTASAGSSYAWSTGASTSTLSVNSSGTYSVTVTDANGCTATATQTVTVNAPVQASISNNNGTTLCQGESTTLTASAGSSYAWSTGASSSTLSVNSSGTYAVTVTDANGCTATASQTVTVNAPAQASISNNNGTTLCQGESTTLTASAGSSYAWSTGASTSTLSVNSSGTYTVTVTDANGCTATASQTVTVNAPAQASISNNNGTTLCQGESTTLTASAGSSYAWSTGASTSTLSVNSSGTYTVTVTDANGCTATASQTVTVNAPVQASISNNNGTTLCQGESTTLTASAGSSYAWSTGASTSTLSVNSSGTYTVTVTDANGCTAVASESVTINAAPTADFSFVSNQLQVDFTDLTTGAMSWAWDFGDGNTASAQNPQHVYGANGTYTVTLISTNQVGCSDTISYSVNVLFVSIDDQLGSGQFSIVGVYPNPFSENLFIELELPYSGLLTIEAVDVLGKRVIPVFSEEVNAGEFKWQWRPESLAEGSYILRMTTGNGEVRFHKLVHLR